MTFAEWDSTPQLSNLFKKEVSLFLPWLFIPCIFQLVSVLVIIPIHSHAETLKIALQSIRNQTYTDIDVQIIGDGASEACIQIAQHFCNLDSRFTLQIHPKSVRRGEEFRHQTIQNSKSTFITYLADDDIFLPDHVEYMLKEVQGFDFVNQRPTFINRRDVIWCMPTDISLESNRVWHLRPPRKNSISFSGVMHAKAAYESLAEGWAPSPKKIWTDLHMWRKFLARSDFRFKTTSKCTVLKFLGDSNVYDFKKIEQNKKWFAKIETPEWQKDWDMQVNRVHQNYAAKLYIKRYPIARFLNRLKKLRKDFKRTKRSK